MTSSAELDRSTDRSRGLCLFDLDDTLLVAPRFATVEGFCDADWTWAGDASGVQRFDPAGRCLGEDRFDRVEDRTTATPPRQRHREPATDVAMDSQTRQQNITHPDSCVHFDCEI